MGEELNLPTHINQKDPSIDKIESEYSIHQTQQSTIPKILTTNPIQRKETHTYNDINLSYRVPVFEQNINMNSPLLAPIHKVPSTKPQTKSFNLDLLLRTIGYQTPMKFLKHYKAVGLDTIHVNNLVTEPLKT